MTMTYHQEMYARSKAEGYCTKCYKRPAVKGRNTCEQCGFEHRMAQSIRYLHNVDNGRCAQCGAPTNGAAYCPACAAKKNQGKRLRYQNRRIQGLCTKCGRKLEDRTKTRCQHCAEKENARHIPKVA